MASVGHVIVGAAAARWDLSGRTTRWTGLGVAVVWAGLSLLPDADVIGFRLGVPYAAPWGHRGATHSLAFACAAAIATWLFAKTVSWAELPARRTALLALAVVASHPLLDTLTNGGLGCALLWPFSQARFFAPWTPLPVAPIGRAFLSTRGLRVALTEVVLMSPLLAYAVWPRKKSVPRRLLMVPWLLLAYSQPAARAEADAGTASPPPLSISERSIRCMSRGRSREVRLSTLPLADDLEPMADASVALIPLDDRGRVDLDIQPIGRTGKRRRITLLPAPPARMKTRSEVLRLGGALLMARYGVGADRRAAPGRVDLDLAWFERHSGTVRRAAIRDLELGIGWSPDSGDPLAPLLIFVAGDGGVLVGSQAQVHWVGVDGEEHVLRNGALPPLDARGCSLLQGGETPRVVCIRGEQAQLFTIVDGGGYAVPVDERRVPFGLETNGGSIQSELVHFGTAYGVLVAQEPQAGGLAKTTFIDLSHPDSARSLARPQTVDLSPCTVEQRRWPHALLPVVPLSLMIALPANLGPKPSPILGYDGRAVVTSMLVHWDDQQACISGLYATTGPLLAAIAARLEPESQRPQLDPVVLDLTPEGISGAFYAHRPGAQNAVDVHPIHCE